MDKESITDRAAAIAGRLVDENPEWYQVEQTFNPNDRRWYYELVAQLVLASEGEELVYVSAELTPGDRADWDATVLVVTGSRLISVAASYHGEVSSVETRVRPLRALKELRLTGGSNPWEPDPNGARWPARLRVAAVTDTDEWLLPLAGSGRAARDALLDALPYLRSALTST